LDSLREVPAELTARYVAQGWWDSRSLGTLIHESLIDVVHLPFVVHSSDRAWRGTIGEVASAARQFAGWLHQRGIGPGDVIVMQLPNWVEAAVTFWGTAFAGAVIVPVVHFYGPKELSHILRDVAPALVVTPNRFARIDYDHSLVEVVGDIPWVMVGEGESALPTAEPLDRPVSVNPDQPAVIAFTSGTTQSPKGVVHSHRTIGFEARQNAAISPAGGPPPLVGAPVGHFMGMLGALLGPLIRGVPIHLIDEWNAAEVLRLMLGEQVGLSGGAPYFFTRLLDHPDFTSAHLRYVPSARLGGSAVPTRFTRRLSGLGIKVTRCYGSTEHPTITGCAFGEDEAKRITTDGHPLAGVEIRLDQEGQILSRGPDLCLGYTDAALTDEAFDSDGWYRTGDVGVLDSDGFLTITDRMSDIIIRGGENISAREVEELLLGLSGVTEVAVVPEPDERFGERGVALIRLADGAGRPDLDQVRNHLAEAGLARQKWPESVRVVKEFPRTASGKVQKVRLRAQLRDGVLEGEVQQ
jgi:acyl-CoA synthetase (AMP-forming)/AMP-acid ligase II